VAVRTEQTPGERPSPASALRQVHVGLREDLEVSRHVFRGEVSYIVRDPMTFQSQRIDRADYELFVNIDERGRYYVTGKMVTLPELDPILKAAWVNNPGRASVVIRADKRVAWQYVVGAMNACNKAKIRDYRVTTRESS